MMLLLMMLLVMMLLVMMILVIERPAENQPGFQPPVRLAENSQKTRSDSQNFWRFEGKGLKPGKKLDHVASQELSSMLNAGQ
eukprot:3882867-Prorocentrum_lima.AAC.1